MAKDVDMDILKTEVAELGLDFQKFFIVTADDLNVMVMSTNNSTKPIPVTTDISLSDFLIDQTADEARLATLKQTFADEIEPELMSLETSRADLRFDDGSGSKVSLIVAPVKL